MNNVDPEEFRTKPYPYDEHIDGDSDGIGAFRGCMYAMGFMLVITGIGLIALFSLFNS